MSDYVIKRGDTLSKIAKQYGTSVETLMKLNPGIRDGNTIFENEKLVLPESQSNSTEFGNRDKLIVEKKMPVNAGDTVESLKANGNTAQRAAASIFDADGDGKFSSKEAKLFNNSTLKLTKEELTIYDNSDEEKRSLTLKYDEEYGLENYKYKKGLVGWNERGEENKENLRLKENMLRNFHKGHITIDRDESVEIQGASGRFASGLSGKISSANGKGGTVEIRDSRIDVLKTNGNEVKGSELKGEHKILLSTGSIIADKDADIELKNSDDIGVDRKKSK